MQKKLYLCSDCSDSSCMETIQIKNTLELVTRLELSGRGISKICTQLDGSNVYLATESARKSLLKRYAATYENGNGDTVRAS